MNYSYSPKDNVRMMPQTNEQDRILYNNNPFTWGPRVGSRPLYYTNPIYEHDPVIEGFAYVRSVQSDTINML